MYHLKDELISRLRLIIGDEHVLTDEHSLALHSQDVFTRDLFVVAVAQPGESTELSQVVKQTTESGFAVVARGGGVSYSSGIVPTTEYSVSIDLSRMNRVLEVNTDDMYVIVESGCTWEKLHQTLSEYDVRTPYWGTLSGRYATIGGSLSQNSIFWGSGQFGSSAETVLALQVIAADGTLIETGASAQRNTSPFLRQFGPDLTGLFTGDCGAFGVKTVASLRLIPTYKARQYRAYSFSHGDDLLNVMSEISRRGLAMECFGFDPFLQAQRTKRESLAKDVKSLTGVMKSAGSIKSALAEGAKIAMSGRGYLADIEYSLQLITEDFCQEGADGRAEEIDGIASKHNGQSIANSIPQIIRSNPFGPLNNMLGPNGERWVPCHVIVPHTEGIESHQAILDLFKKYEKEFEEFSIETGFLYTTISTNAVVLEPVFFWPDAITEVHEHHVESDHLKRLQRFPEDLEARAMVGRVRKEFAEMFRVRGGIHLQVGKVYSYSDGLHASSLELVKAIKHEVDPKCLLNPGVLGLTADTL